jgi:hypothetical protein
MISVHRWTDSKRRIRKMTTEQRVYDALVYGYQHTHLPLDTAWKEFVNEHPVPADTDGVVDNPPQQFDIDCNKWRNRIG